MMFQVNGSKVLFKVELSEQHLTTQEIALQVDNFLPSQYLKDRIIPINHCYLREQFSDYNEILDDIADLVKNEDFTLGQKVDEFEEYISQMLQVKHVIGVNSGTDAIRLSLIALGIGPGDEVITTPYTFYATIGAIHTTGAKPVFVDIGEDYNIDASKIEQAINSKTKAILPVHWAGLCCDMNAILQIASSHGLHVVEDSCHGILGRRHDRFAGTFGSAGCFSMHPLKNLNVWGDGGFIVTDSDETNNKLRLLRNHGLVDRDQCFEFGYNSRLDTIQAIVGLHALEKLENLTNARIRNAEALDSLLSDIPEVSVPVRPYNTKQVYHLYIVKAKKRDELLDYLRSKGVDAKVHYPTPMHLQPAAGYLNYKEGDFPVCESTCKQVISLPVHEFITTEDTEKIAKEIKSFYQL